VTLSIHGKRSQGKTQNLLNHNRKFRSGQKNCEEGGVRSE
jgi:hypothetical protein